MSKRSYVKFLSPLSAGKFYLRLFSAAGVLIIVIILSGCFSSKIVDSRKEFYAGRNSAASGLLAELKDKEGKDQILVLMDYGIAQHVAGNYRQSANALLEANRLIELNDIIRVKEKTTSVVTNKMMTTFKPEDFERVLVHTYLAMNFMMLDDWTAARVEAKKALRRLGKLKPELALQPYTRYICGLSFEVMGDLESAYIEYSRVAKAEAEFLPIYYDLYRLAAMRGLGPEAEEWAQEIGKRGGDLPPQGGPPNLIVFVGAGRSPIKKEINLVVPPQNRFVVPDYKSSGSLAHHAALKIDNKGTISSTILTDLNPLAEKTLKGRIAKEIAAETLRVAAKEVITRQIEEQNSLVGLVFRVAVIASEAADVRSWETLPRYLGVIQTSLPPGSYDIQIEFYTRRGNLIGVVEHREVVISEGRRTILSVRSVK
jgi:tetratricopeptide (TPR) repeat protein